MLVAIEELRRDGLRKPGWGLGQFPALGDTLSPGPAKAGVSVGDCPAESPERP